MSHECAITLCVALLVYGRDNRYGHIGRYHPLVLLPQMESIVLISTAILGPKENE